MKIFYDIPYMKDIMLYVLIPVLAVIIIVGTCLFVYSNHHKDHDDPHYNFVMDFWSSLIGIIVTGAILAIAVGFSVAMTEKMREYGLVEEKKILYYLLKYFVILPFIFVFWYIVKFLKTIYYKPRKQKPDHSKEIVPTVSPDVASVVANSNEEVVNSVQVEPVVPAVENVTSEKAEVVDEKVEVLPPIEETIEEEMKQFPSAQKAPNSENTEEVEVISLEDEL